MKPKEKAKELHNKYCTMMSHCDDAVECALIAVDEILKITSLINDGCGEETTLDYWQEVKTEIEQL